VPPWWTWWRSRGDDICLVLGGIYADLATPTEAAILGVTW
jgi:hypothetical protein